MRIGLDFDNTIACYDGVFHAAAVERGMIPAEGVATDKASVRDYLRSLGRDADFTELQGYVYGPGMKHVGLFDGVERALSELCAAGHDLFIISHKTRVPFAGPPYDLHRHAHAFLAARRWADSCFGNSRVFFEPTKEEKVARVRALACEVFIDDLPEILALEGYPPGLRKILFDPEGRYVGPLESCRDWRTIAATLLGACAP
ncbi:hypothetical protein [Phenylobacterium sp.]|uniref:hypothetical protein n=1 Tax=Phenylobacterium sp. TaxID=1871053 RepID=UPI002F41D41F